jgi:adenosylcobyric acid synthase
MKSIMVVGTNSRAGKSLLATALCRILLRRGWRVTPFQGQTIGSNVYVTPTGGEIGFSQAVQAWAAGVMPVVEMNPILVKTEGDDTYQVSVQGKVLAKTKLSDYYENYAQPSWQAIEESLERLGEVFDLIVCQGSGSPAESHLKQYDITNMQVARHLKAPTLLVVDVSDGGAFAHIVGTLSLLEAEERNLIKGIVLNKFSGERSLLEPGIKWLQEQTGIRVVGVIPPIAEIANSEDSLDLIERQPHKRKDKLTIAIVRLPRIYNFTDFDPLEAEPTVSLKYIGIKESLGYPDAVIVPGSKKVIADLIALQQSGMAVQLQEYAAAGGTILGICSGFQMLGQTISDPEGIEDNPGDYPGLNLLPIQTIVTHDKVARQRLVNSQYPQVGFPINGYEIRQGRSRSIESKGKNAEASYHSLFDEPGLGMVNEAQSLWGCYLHGLFDNSPWRRAWLNNLRHQRGLSSLPTGIANYREQREAILNFLADSIEKNLDLSTILPHG